MFKQRDMTISYEDSKGLRKTIRNNADVFEAILNFHKLADPDATSMVVRLDAELTKAGNVTHKTQLKMPRHSAKKLHYSDSYAHNNSFHTSLADKDIAKALNDISLNASNGMSLSTACSAIFLAV